MISRVLAAALVAGFLAACVSSILQIAFTTPLILAAESFEAAPAAAPHSHEADAAHQHETGGWKPADGFERAAFTGLAALVSGVGYALLLGAAALAMGLTPGRRNALALAAAGFVALNLAPALGLPPELPGMGGGALVARQLWWLATALATGAGLYLLVMVRSPIALAAGLALIAAPHLVGAPAAPHVHSEVPPLLAAQFAARSLAVALAFWISLGLALGWAWERLDAKPKDSLAAA
jgi:cobalt transporter subunit CbtA